VQQSLFSGAHTDRYCRLNSTQERRQVSTQTTTIGGDYN